MNLSAIGQSLRHKVAQATTTIRTLADNFNQARSTAAFRANHTNAEGISHLVQQVAANQSRDTSVASQVSTSKDKAGDLHESETGGGVAGGNPAGRDPQTVSTPIKTTKEAVITREVTPSKVAGAQPSEHIVIDTGAGNDRIGITRDKKTGFTIVNINGERQVFSGADANRLLIRAGNGNDTVSIARDINVRFVIEGGDGDDRIQGGSGNDLIEGGAGNDRIDGGAGRDYINGNAGDDTLYGAAGDDVIYGGDGNDKIQGNAGRDYLEGSTGNDAIKGGAGDDVVSGGMGADTLEGGAGDDVLYAGAGRDTLHGSTIGDRNAARLKQKDVIYHQSDDKVVSSNGNPTITVALNGTPGSRGIRIVGTPEFVERVEADIEMLRSSPTGRQMLTEFDKRFDSSRHPMSSVPLIGSLFNDGHTLTIQELPDENNGFAQGQGNLYLDAAGKPGGGSDATISYNSQFQESYFPAPIVVLYHEMSHAYNVVNGTFQQGTHTGTDKDGPIGTTPGVNNRERQAVGLANSGIAVDLDGNALTPPSTANPKPLTENGLREELNLPARQSYRL